MADALTRAVVAADDRAVVRTLRGMPEPERRAAAKAMLELARQLAAFRVLKLGRFRGLRFARYDSDSERDRSNAQWRAAALAVLGTATLAEQRELDRTVDRRVPVDPELGLEVLLDRRPPWLAGWADWRMADSAYDWRTVRALVRAGVIERSPLYVNRILWAPCTYEPARHGARRLLDDDPDLLREDVWAMLRDPGPESLRAADDHYGYEWRETISERVADGRMDRDRLLDLVVDVLAGDLDGYRAAWYTGLWKALSATPDEAAARTPALRVLLGAATPQIASFGVDQLVRARADVPPGELTVVLAAPAKKTVLGALKLLDRAPDGALATVALGHEHADVQRAVLDRLERWGLTDAARDALLRHLDLLAATQRPRAEALLGIAVPAAEDVVAVDVSPIPEPIRAALGFGGPLPDAPVPGEPVLGETIAPIETLDALADALLTSLTNLDQREDDRLLDGLSRLCDQPFDGPLRPLRERIERSRITEFSPFWDLRAVAAAWLLGETGPGHTHDVWRQRLAEVAHRAARGKAYPLLAAPTHAGGWIDPRVLVDRMREDPDEYDLAQALLRLAPDHRAEALEAARAIPGRPGKLLRCALGDGPVEDAGVAASAALAAGGHTRVRIELDDDLKPSLTVNGGNLQLTEDGQVGDGVIEEHVRAAVPKLKPYPVYRPVQVTGWPARRELVCTSALAHLTQNLSYDGHSYAAPLLEALLPATEPLPPLALRLATLALGSANEHEHLLATDLLIAGIEDGRIDALPVDDVKRIKPNRLAARLQAVAAAGPLHGAVVRELLDAAVEHLPDRPGPALTLFDELCAQTGVGPRRSRDALAALKQKAARSLLKRDGEPGPAEAQLRLAARVRRAQRWIG